jgi:hypothetical protein
MSLLTFVSGTLLGKEGLGEYQEKLQEFLADGKLSKLEQLQLEGMRNKFGLTQEDLKQMHTSMVSAAYQTMVSDRLITEEEKASLELLFKYFKVAPKDTAFNQKTFNRYYTLALLENGLLPHITAEFKELPIILKEGEVLHYASGALLHVPRSVAKEKGAFYITNKELGFHGTSSHMAVTLGTLQALQKDKDALAIFQRSKKTPVKVTLEDYEVPIAVVKVLTA